VEFYVSLSGAASQGPLIFLVFCAASKFQHMVTTPVIRAQLLYSVVT